MFLAQDWFWRTASPLEFCALTWTKVLNTHSNKILFPGYLIKWLQVVKTNAQFLSSVCCVPEVMRFQSPRSLLPLMAFIIRRTPIARVCPPHFSSILEGESSMKITKFYDWLILTAADDVFDPWAAPNKKPIQWRKLRDLAVSLRSKSKEFFLDKRSHDVPCLECDIYIYTHRIHVWYIYPLPLPFILKINHSCRVSHASPMDTYGMC